MKLQGTRETQRAKSAPAKALIKVEKLGPPARCRRSWGPGKPHHADDNT